MKVVARRVVERAMLALVKMFLEAPISDEREGRPKRNTQGTPQGGVISPLLANLNLDLLDRNFRRRVESGELRGRLIRYADDFVVLVPRKPDREMEWIGHLMGRLGLKLHPTKTRVLNAREGQQFDFLGHTHRWQEGRLYLDASKKALGRIREELRRKTRKTGQTTEQLVRELNPYIRGAREYFRRIRRKTLSKLDHFINGRLARWWARKHASPRPAWSLVQHGAFRREHGLERWYFPWAVLNAASRTRR
jgi:RNA-directed DNA polymerase